MTASSTRILLVDDDADIREALRDALEDEGYELLEASDGKKALAFLRTHPAPPLILLDWNMAPMNGAQFIAEIAKEPALAQIPLILLTADAGVSARWTSTGAAGYLSKPVELSALLDVIAQYCGRP